MSYKMLPSEIQSHHSFISMTSFNVIYFHPLFIIVFFAAFLELFPFYFVRKAEVDGIFRLTSCLCKLNY